MMPDWLFILIVTLMFIMLTVLMIPWRMLFEKLFGNNPLKAKVYVETGEQETICNGYYIGDCYTGDTEIIESDSGNQDKGDNLGCLVYEYAFNGKRMSVLVPFTYPYRYVLGRRRIRVILGQSEAAPLGPEFTSHIPLSASMLDTILTANIGKGLISTVFGKNLNWLMILLVAGALIFGGIFIYNTMKQETPVIPGSANTTIIYEAETPDKIEIELREEGLIK